MLMPPGRDSPTESEAGNGVAVAPHVSSFETGSSDRRFHTSWPNRFGDDLLCLTCGACWPEEWQIEQVCDRCKCNEFYLMERGSAHVDYLGNHTGKLYAEAIIPQWVLNDIDAETGVLAHQSIMFQPRNHKE